MTESFWAKCSECGFRSSNEREFVSPPLGGLTCVACNEVIQSRRIPDEKMELGSKEHSISKIRMEALEIVALEARNELLRATYKYPPHNSAHESFAILQEEVCELWEHVKTNQDKRFIDSMRKEAIQVAAMAMRFVFDCCEPHGKGYRK